MRVLHFAYLGLIAILSFMTPALAQSEFKYSYVPKTVYENQLFPVTIIGIAENGSHESQFVFDAQSSIQPLFPKPLIVRNGNDSFYTFYFKASAVDVYLPKLLLTSQNIDYNLPSQRIPIRTLKKRKDFSGVLAADMKIKNSQVSNFDEKNHIVTLSIEAFEANMEDMNLSEVKESGIETLKRENAKVEAEYYVVLPLEEKKLKFTYFNTIKKQYVFLEVPTIVVDAAVTTQSDLNPKEDNFAKLKKYTFMALFIFFFIMFLFRRDFFYLVLGVVSLITLLTFYVPHKKICVKQGSSLYILPTETSTVSAYIDAKLDTVILGEREGYQKVEYKKGIIGWIKNENLCEH
ncbi:MAG: hypothetical protein DRQ78_03320 [Epsilonproteobacteria bacterium]|nr:MAG: hypothetical protein DRQ78_03320 [Campylobacterota bacterium]